MSSFSTYLSATGILVAACPALILLPVSLLLTMKLRLAGSRRRTYWIGIACQVLAIAMYPAFYWWILSTTEGPGGSGVFFLLVVPFSWMFSALGLVLTLVACRQPRS